MMHGQNNIKRCKILRSVRCGLRNIAVGWRIILKYIMRKNFVECTHLTHNKEQEWTLRNGEIPEFKLTMPVFRELLEEYFPTFRRIVVP